jgi:hypothetical protein
VRWKTSICVGVCAVHVAFFIAMSFAHIHKPAPKKHLVVTMRAAPPSVKTPKKIASAPIAQKASPPAAVKIPPAVKKPAPAKKIEHKPVAAAKKTPAPSVSKQTVAKKKEAPKKAAPPVFEPVPENLIAELEESIAKIEQKQDKIYRQRLKSDPSFAESQAFGEGEYKDALISYLHQSLNLPEWGEVKIKLTLKKDGSVAHVAVLKAESAKNRLHLEKNLPLLRFPPLDASFASEEQHVFVLTFCNEI